MNPKNHANTGIILFGHGSRDPQWRLPIEAVAESIRVQQPGTPVACAYLELCEPSLPQAATDLIALGVLNIRVLPVFFGVGKHAREDLPLIVEQIRAEHPQVMLQLLPTAGESPELRALVARIALGGTL